LGKGRNDWEEVRGVYLNCSKYTNFMVLVHAVNAFAKKRNGGNSAGVCLDADRLNIQEMQRIAARVGFSETAFVQKSDRADFKVRFFTPVNEVALCGHATIATFYLLASLGRIGKGRHTQETKAGVLDIEIADDNLIFMNQNPPQFLGTVDKEEIIRCFANLRSGDISMLPIEIVSTGLPVMLVPVVSLRRLLTLVPDFRKITEITERYGRTLMYVFTMQTELKGSTAHGRMFAPSHGIPEESATGMANGALECYLFKHSLTSDPLNLVFEQGYSLARPSEILGRLIVEAGEIKQVIIGGRAIVAGQIEV